MDAQQLAIKVTQLESRVATLEDEGKIIKGEVKQILTEIRSAILVRDNPFESENASARPGATAVAPQPITKIEVVMPEQHEAAPPTVHEEPVTHAPPPAHASERAHAAPQPQHTTDERAPVPIRPQAQAATPTAPAHQLEPEKPHWSLLTVAGLAAWSEEAMRRLGSLRLEILLDLCEAAGHISADARQALARVTELDIAEPAQAPSTNETVVILRQLDALVTDDADAAPTRILGLL